MSWLVAALAAIAPVQAAAEQAAPAAAVTILSPAGDADMSEADRRPMGVRIHELLVTLHDLGRIRYIVSEQPPAAFAACLALAPGAERDRCIGRALGPAEGAPRIVILVESMRWRSAAAGVTCIGAGGAIGRTPIHLRDIFHRYDFVREGQRRVMAACIEEALGRAE